MESVTISYQDKCSDESKLDFLKLSQKNEGSASPSKPFQDIKSPSYIAEHGFGYTDNGFQCDDTELKENCITKVATSDMDNNSHTVSTGMCCTIAQILVPCLEEDEQQHPVIETDTADSQPCDDAGGVSADTTRHDLEQLGKSLDYWSLVTGRAFPQKEEVRRRWGQNGSTHIGAVGLDASELSEVKDTVFYESVAVKECNQTGDVHGCSADVPPNKGEEQAKCRLSRSDYMGSKSSCSHSEVRPPGTLVGDAKNEVKHPARWETDVKENATVCDEGIIYEHGRDDKDSAVETADCAEVAIVPCDVILASNSVPIGAELSLTDETDEDLHSTVAWWRAADEIIVEVHRETAGHSAETKPASSSQGDNEVGLYCVIDPVIWSQTGAGAEKKHHDSASTTGVEPTTSLTLSMQHTHILEHTYVRPCECAMGEISDSVQTGSSSSGGAQQQQPKTEFLCQASTGHQCCSFNLREIHRELGAKEACHRDAEPSSSLHMPSERFHACNQVKENSYTLGHLNEKQVPAGCFLISPKHCKSLETEYLTTDVSVKGEMPERKASKEVMSSFGEALKIHANFENSNRPMPTNEEHNEHMTEQDCADNKISSSNSFADCKLKAETSMTENEGRHLSSITSPPLPYFASVDAVVPSAHYLNPRPLSQNADDTSPQQSNGRSVSVPSALIPFDCFAGGFDSFEKIQLSPNDDDDAEGLGHSPLLTSLPSQLLNAPHEQGHNQRAKSENSKNECQDEHYMEVDRILSGEVPESSAFREPYQSDLTPESKQFIIPSKKDNTDSEISRYSEFEMKEQFDVVIEEMKLYFCIDSNGSAADGATLFQNGDVSKPEKASTISSGNHPSRPAKVCPPDAPLSGDKSNDCRAVEPRISCTAKPDDCEQEVPLDFSHSCQQEDEAMYPVVEQRNLREVAEKKRKWTPSFMFLPCLGPTQRQPDHTQRLQRLEPLRTCKRPIRVGLSKKAKTKHLHPHRSNPYQYEM